MANRGLFTFLVVILGLGILFAGAVNVGYDNADRQFAVDGEDMTVDYTDVVPVDEQPDDAEYNQSVTIINSSDVELTDGTDYEWDATNGEVTFINTNSTTDGETVAIDYQYRATPEETKAFGGAIEVVGIALIFIMALLAVQWLFDVVGDF